MKYECCECFEEFDDCDYNDEPCCPHCQSLDFRKFNEEERTKDHALDRKFDEERGK